MHWMLPLLGLPALPAVELSCSGLRGSDAGGAAPGKPGQAELWNWEYTQAFPMGGKPGEAAQSSSHQAGLVPRKQGLQTSPDLMVLVVSKLR